MDYKGIGIRDCHYLVCVICGGGCARERAEVLGIKLRLSSLYSKHRFLLSHLPNTGLTSFKMERVNRMGGEQLVEQQGTGNGEWAMGTTELDGAQDRVYEGNELK